MAGAYLTIIQGDSYTLSTNVSTDSVAQNIAGATVSLYALASLDSGADVLINVNTAGAVSITGNNNATVTVSLNSAYTANITQANGGHWWLRCNTSTGDVYTLDRGRIAVVPGNPAIPF